MMIYTPVLNNFFEGSSSQTQAPTDVIHLPHLQIGVRLVVSFDKPGLSRG
jgi:hypothetical protein